MATYISKSRARIAIAAAVLVLVSEAVLYFTLVGLFDRSVEVMQEHAVDQMASFNAAAVNQLQQQAHGVAVSPNLARILRTGYSITTDFDTVRALVESIGAIANHVPRRYAAEAYAYSEATGAVITGQGFIDKSAAPQQETIEALGDGTHDYRWSVSAGNRLVYVAPVPLSGAERAGAVFIEVDRSLAGHWLSDRGPLGPSAYYVLNRDGVVLASQLDDNLIEYFAPDDTEEHLRGFSEGAAVHRLGGEAYATYVQAAGTTGWRYLVFAPASLFRGQSELVVVSGVAIALMFVAAAVLASFPLSKLVYRPIRALSERIDTEFKASVEADSGASPVAGMAGADDLERIAAEFSFLAQTNREHKERFERDKEALRDGFVRDILMGRISDDTGLRRDAEYLDVAVDVAGFSVVLVSYPKAVAPTAHGRQLFRQTIRREIGRVPTDSHARVYVVNEADYALVLIGHDTADARAAFSVSDGLIRRLSRLFSDPILICVGSFVDAVGEVVFSTRDAQRLFGLTKSSPDSRVVSDTDLLEWGMDRGEIYSTERAVDTVRRSLEVGNIAEARETVARLIKEGLVSGNPAYRRLKVTELGNVLISHVLLKLGWSDFFADANPWIEVQKLVESADPAEWFTARFEELQKRLEASALSGTEILVERIKRRIDEKYTEPLTVDDLAEEFQISRSHFSSIFKKGMGATFVEYLNRVRVDAACELLRNSDRLVKQIAVEAGFGSKQNFIRVFRTVTGLTPSEFRHKEQTILLEKEHS